MVATVGALPWKAGTEAVATAVLAGFAANTGAAVARAAAALKSGALAGRG